MTSRICDRPPIYATKRLLDLIESVHADLSGSPLDDPRVVLQFVLQGSLDAEGDKQMREIVGKVSTDDAIKRFEKYRSRIGGSPSWVLSLEGIQGPHGEWDNKVTVGSTFFDLKITTFPDDSPSPSILDVENGKIIISAYAPNA